MQNKLGKQKLWHICIVILSILYTLTQKTSRSFIIYLIRVHGLKNTSFLYLTSHTVYDLNITVTGKID